MKKRQIDKWKIVTIAGVIFFVLGIASLVWVFCQMNSYRQFTLSLAYDLESPEVVNKVKMKEHSLRISEENRKALSYYLNTEQHKPSLLPFEKVVDEIQMQCIRGDGNVSKINLYKRNNGTVYLDYTSKQGHWKYDLSGYCKYDVVAELLKPEGGVTANTILKH
ncbi:MAG: hypothetical protein RSD28_06975 [Lachnospiraceae bacterium]